MNSMGLAGIDQTDLVQYTDKWRNAVKRVLNLLVPANLELFSSKEGFCSME
jgi:hypothetical protein